MVKLFNHDNYILNLVMLQHIYQYFDKSSYYKKIQMNIEQHQFQRTLCVPNCHFFPNAIWLGCV